MCVLTSWLTLHFQQGTDLTKVPLVTVTQPVPFRVWAARYYTGILIKLTSKGVVFSFLSNLRGSACTRTVQQISWVLACVQAMSRAQQPVAQAGSRLPAHQSNKRPLETAAGPEVNTARGPIVDSSAHTATGVVIPEAAAKAAKHTASSTPLSMSQPVVEAGAPGAILQPLNSTPS